MTTDHITKPTFGRRTLVAGAAWSVPVIIATAPAATAGPSQCTVNAGVNVGPFATSRMRAICSSNSQTPTGGTTIWCNYGYVYGPQYLEICNCTGDSAWYSWRETDSVSDFQIEVNGIQDDENGPTRGWRPPFKLAPVGESGGCQRFALTYRTSDSRPYNSSTTEPTSGAWTGNTINVTLYRNSSTLSTAPAYPGPNADGTGNSWTIGRVDRHRGPGQLQQLLCPGRVPGPSCPDGPGHRVGRRLGCVDAGARVSRRYPRWRLTSTSGLPHRSSNRCTYPG